MALVQNQPFFYFLFLSNIIQKNVFYNNIEQKTAFLTFQKHMFKKSKNRNFSKVVGPWFWSKNWPFIHLLFLTNIGQEKVFYDILERKNAFLRNKKKSSKRRKKEIFPKGLVHGLGQNIGHFSFFLFLSNIGQKNVFYDILERINAYLCFKNNKLKKSKH